MQRTGEPAIRGVSAEVRATSLTGTGPKTHPLCGMGVVAQRLFASSLVDVAWREAESAA